MCVRCINAAHSVEFHCFTKEHITDFIFIFLLYLLTSTMILLLDISSVFHVFLKINLLDLSGRVQIEYISQ